MNSAATVLVPECPAGVMSSASAASSTEAAGRVRAEIDRYHQALLNVAYRILNDAEAARDVVQDAYVAVLQADGTAFKGNSSLKTYLYRIVINRCIDARRRKARWLGFVDIWRHERPPTRIDAESTMDYQEMVRVLFAGIPETFRIPLVLAEVDGMRYEEIAQTLGISLNTVRTRIHRCREKLRQAYVKTGRKYERM